MSLRLSSQVTDRISEESHASHQDIDEMCDEATMHEETYLLV